MNKARKKALAIQAAADKMQAGIDAKRDPAIGHQNLTARRADIAVGMAKEAQHLEAIQRCLRGVADGILDGHLEHDGPLAKSGTKAGMERLVSWGKNGRLPGVNGWNKDEGKKLAKVGINSDDHLKACWGWVESHYRAAPEPTREMKVKALERKLIGVKVDGFFPTPPALADRVVEEADIREGDLVLEPSAGKGDLIEAVLRRQPRCHVVAVERVWTLTAILREKFEHVKVEDPMDFIEWAGQFAWPTFDRVVMNPPFEKGQDADHVQAAYALLKPGGTLVSITGAGLWTNDSAKCRAFRRWVEALDHEVEDLPEDSFKGEAAFRQTGVRCRLLILTKEKA